MLLFRLSLLLVVSSCSGGIGLGCLCLDVRIVEEELGLLKGLLLQLQLLLLGLWLLLEFAAAAA